MEDQADYITETQEAMEMLGKGYEPSIEIEQPRNITERRGSKLVEVERQAFVKLYTSFKCELKNMEGGELKVWLYLALSVNRFTKDARPGLRKIADDTNMSVNTVRNCIEKLEERGLLDVEKEGGKSSIYHPADYVSVSKIDTLTVSKNGGTVSKKEGTVSATRREFAQLEELEELEESAATPQLSETEKVIKDLSLENQIFLGKIKITHSRADEIKNALRQYFRLTPRWSSRFDKQWMEWALDENMTAYQIRSASEIWGKDRRFNWAAPSLKGIADHWLELKGEQAAQLSPYEQALSDLQKASANA